METKEEMDLKVKKQTEKVMLALAGIFFIGCMVYVFKKNNVKVNACDCADLSSKSQLMGEWNMKEADRNKLIECESVYTYSEQAYNDCVNGMLYK
jgi:hypothetical protein